MEIEATARFDVAIIEPKGRLTLETEGQFTSTIQRCLDAGQTRLLLNLGHVPYIDSCGLGAIVRAFVSARRRGGDLVLLNVAGRNQHLLTVTKLLTVFKTYDADEPGSLRSRFESFASRS
jgi:anti-sigma B factor antagonist